MTMIERYQDMICQSTTGQKDKTGHGIIYKANIVTESMKCQLNKG